MKRRNRRHVISDDNTTFSDPSMMKSILGYTINLVNRAALTENLLTQCIQCLSIQARNELVDSIYPPPVNTEDDRFMDIYENAVEDIGRPSNLSSTLLRDIYKKKTILTINAVTKKISILLEKENKKIKTINSSFDRRFDELSRIFMLSSSDITLLRLLYLTFAISNDTLNSIFDQKNYNEFNRLASFATGLSPVEIRKSLSNSSLLVSTGIIESIDHTAHNFVSIDNSIAEYLTGLSGRNIVEKYVKLDTAKRLKLEDFSIPIEDSAIIKDILNTGTPCSLLLYGIPGTGKTEYARTIASQCSDRVYSVRYGDQVTGSRRGRNSVPDSRFIALKVAINTVSENGGILIVDEADFLLNTISLFFDSSSPEKGWLNDLLDNSNARIIWITNKTGSMEESTLRRFSYSLSFKKFDKEQRISVWNNILKRNPLKKYISPAMISELSEKYEVNAGAISSSLKALKQINENKKLDPTEIKSLLENFLNKHSVLLNSDVKNKNRLVELTGKYDLSFLNTDTDINNVVHSVQSFSKQSNPALGINNINLLLWGESGTGKTEFAKYLGAQSGMSLIIKRASDLKDMWVGNTEKYINQAFREAEEKKSILFIDEADTFFSSRNMAVRSWEVSQTNEFLVQMENFNGILICCTNLLEIFDTAAMRRFNLKIKFNPLLPDKRFPLYVRYFGNENTNVLTAKHKKRISAIENLTPGHAKAVQQRMLFLPDNNPDHDTIIDELVKEASYMNMNIPKKTGFAV